MLWTISEQDSSQLWESLGSVVFVRLRKRAARVGAPSAVKQVSWWLGSGVTFVIEESLWGKADVVADKNARRAAQAWLDSFIARGVDVELSAVKVLQD